jgi:hypothetical protein
MTKTALGADLGLIGQSGDFNPALTVHTTFKIFLNRTLDASKRTQIPGGSSMGPIWASFPPPTASFTKTDAANHPLARSTRIHGFLAVLLAVPEAYPYLSRQAICSRGLVGNGPDGNGCGLASYP